MKFKPGHMLWIVNTTNPWRGDYVQIAIIIGRHNLHEGFTIPGYIIGLFEPDGSLKVACWNRIYVEENSIPFLGQAKEPTIEKILLANASQYGCT